MSDDILQSNRYVRVIQIWNGGKDGNRRSIEIKFILMTYWYYWWTRQSYLTPNRAVPTAISSCNCRRVPSFVLVDSAFCLVLSFQFDWRGRAVIEFNLITWAFLFTVGLQSGPWTVILARSLIGRNQQVLRVAHVGDVFSGRICRFHRTDVAIC